MREHRIFMRLPSLREGHRQLASHAPARISLASGIMNDAPVQVPSAVVFLTFAVLLLATLLLIRSMESLRRIGARRARWFARGVGSPSGF
jgi:hypothetical protein